jgi:ribosome-associated toxin RatA of RatAB toxin-antitoxin module
MRHLEVTASITGQSASELFPLLCDMEQYPKSCEAILSLKVSSSENSTTISKWTVKFGHGVATWTEEDLVDVAATTIRFRRLSGDIDSFTGSWIVRDNEDGCTVHFAADFDIGLPGLAVIIEPMIASTLRQNITAIMKGILGEHTVIHA